MRVTPIALDTTPCSGAAADVATPCPCVRQSEEALRRAVYGACGLRRPAQVLAGLLEQPFIELRLASYRYDSEPLNRGGSAVHGCEVVR
jgi:hypothetical protein